MKEIRIVNKQHCNFADNMIDSLDYPIKWKAIINKNFCKVFRQKINIEKAINSFFVHQQQSVRKCNKKRYWGSGSRPICVPAVRVSPTGIYHWIPKDPPTCPSPIPMLLVMSPGHHGTALVAETFGYSECLLLPQRSWTGCLSWKSGHVLLLPRPRYCLGPGW